jgi:hypothetical protein
MPVEIISKVSLQLGKHQGFEARDRNKVDCVLDEMLQPFRLIEITHCANLSCPVKDLFVEKSWAIKTKKTLALPHPINPPLVFFQFT